MLIIHSMHRHSLEKKRFFLAQKCTFSNPQRLEYFHEEFKRRKKMKCSFHIFIPRPKSGSMLLYSRKKVRYRRDGYCWKKRKDGKTTREDHMKLKVQGTEVCAHIIIC